MSIELYHGDCLEVMDVLIAMGVKVDCIVTSPPYDNLRTYNNSSTWNFEKFKLIANKLYQIISDGGVIVWIVADGTEKSSETGTSFKQALYFKEIGFNIHDTMIWEKDTFSFPHNNLYRSCFEYMFVLSKSKPKTANLISDRKNKYAGTQIHGTSRDVEGNTFRKSNDKKGNVKEFGVRFNVWHLSTEKNNKTGHPAVFPIQLAKDHIITWSNEGDTILDPFMGSGTTGVACKRLNRNFIGIEIDEKYFNIAKERINEA